MIRTLRYPADGDGEVFARPARSAGLEAAVRGIIGEVRKDGDEALVRFARKFDLAEIEQVEVTDREKEEALRETDPDFLRILRAAAENIAAFHARQRRNGVIAAEREGVLLGWKETPIEKVGLYVPGGTAAYPSTVLMGAIPAKIAGCGEICVISPPDRRGRVHPSVLAAAQVAGADRVFKSGGAQAVAALAYGTRTVPRVDKVFGPGNAYVAEAKRQVFGDVAVDMIAGPSEVLIIADGAADPRHAAADLLAQAEHDSLASAVLVTDSPAFAQKVRLALEEQILLLPRQETARASIDANGRIILVESLADAVEVANRFAPEHLELCVRDPFSYFGSVRNAGAVFMGGHSPEALGDYFAGTNHTLPTGGAARFSSPLSVDDFVKRTQFVHYTREAFFREAEDVARFAETEGFQAHAASVRVRLGGEKR